MTDNEAKAESSPTFVTRSRPVTALKAIVWGAVAVLLYVAHVAFIPLALALLFGLVLSAPVEALHKIRVPRSLSAALILVLALSALGGIVTAMWTPAQEWFAKAPQTMTTIRQKVSPIAKFMNHLDDLRKNAGNLGAQGHPAPAAPAAVTATATQSAPALILDVGAPAIASILTFVIVTLFLLTGGPPMMARMTAAFVDNLNAAYVLNIIEKVRAEVGHFYLTTTVINVGLGLVTGLPRCSITFRMRDREPRCSWSR